MKRDDIDVEHYKRLLNAELELLQTELASVGRVNPDNPADWEATPPEMDNVEADRNESADKIEGYEANTAILKELESRYNAVKEALKDIEEGTYGICKEGGEEISIERLEANPSARTCINHA